MFHAWLLWWHLSICVNVLLSLKREQRLPLNWYDWPLKMIFSNGRFETLFKASHIQPWVVVRLALYASVRSVTFCERVKARMIMWGLNRFNSLKVFCNSILFDGDWKIENSSLKEARKTYLVEVIKFLLLEKQVQQSMTSNTTYPIVKKLCSRAGDF